MSTLEKVTLNIYKPKWLVICKRLEMSSKTYISFARGQGNEAPAEHRTNYTHSMNFRISFLYFFTVESALDLNNVERKSFKSGFTLVGR